MPNYLIKNGTMTLRGALVAGPGDVVTAEDLEKSGIGVTRALEDLKVVEETSLDRRILALDHPEAAALAGSNAPAVLDDEGNLPGVPQTPDLRSSDMPTGKPKQIARA